MATIVAENASVHPRAEIDDDVEIGPFCVVGAEAKIGAGTRLENNVTLMGRVTLGRGNHIYPNAVIGGEPQDISYQGAPAEVIIGDHNVIREGVTINRGTEKEEGITSLGDHNFLMACCHVAHDCKLGSRIIICNNTLLGGHVRIQDHVSISGGVAVHHFVTIGRYSFVGGMSRALHDVPPYMLVDGSPCRPRCVNVVALKRASFPAETISRLAETHRLLYRAKVGLENARDILGGYDALPPEVGELLGFVEHMQEGRHGRSRDRRKAA